MTKNILSSGRAIAGNKDSGHYEVLHFDDGRPFGEGFHPIAEDWAGNPYRVGIWRGLGSSGNYTHGMDETYYIIQGWMEITTEEAETILLRAGDFIAFKQGTEISFRTSPDLMKFAVSKS